MSSENSIPYVVSETDRAAAARIITDRTQANESSHSLLIGCLGLLIIVMFMGAMIAVLWSPPKDFLAGGVLGLGGVCGGFYVTLRTIRGISLRYPARSIALPQTFRATDTGLWLEWPHRRTFEPWSQYTGFTEAQGVIVLFAATGSGKVLPLHAAPPEEREQIRTHLRTAYEAKHA